MTAIKAALAGVSPAPQGVYFGEPLSMQMDRLCAFWYAGESDQPSGRETLGNVMVAEEFTLRYYWRVQATGQPTEGLEQEVWNMSRLVQAALRADSNLGGNCTDLKIGMARTGYIPDWGARTLTIPFEIWGLEEEAIAP